MSATSSLQKWQHPVQNLKRLHLNVVLNNRNNKNLRHKKLKI